MREGDAHRWHVCVLEMLRPSQVPKALNRNQLAAMIGAADAASPALVIIAAYVATGVVESDRAKTQVLTEWEQVAEIVENGKIVGYSKQIPMDKGDRLQRGKVKDTPCASTCQGYVVVDDEGFIDASAVCPTHLLLYAKKLWAKSLGVQVSDIVGQVFADLCKLSDVPRGYTLVVWSEGSPGHLLAGQLAERGVKVMTRAEEASSKQKTGLYFEVQSGLYATHPWGDSRTVTYKLRSLALLAQKAAKKKGVQGEFGDAYRMKDFTFELGSKSVRRTFVSRGLAGGIAPHALMERTYHNRLEMLMRYQDPDPKVVNKGGENITDVILHGAVRGDVSKEGMIATIVQQGKMLLEQQAEVVRLRALLNKHGVPCDRDGASLVVRTEQQRSSLQLGNEAMDVAGACTATTGSGCAGGAQLASGLTEAPAVADSMLSLYEAGAQLASGLTEAPAVQLADAMTSPFDCEVVAAGQQESGSGEPLVSADFASPERTRLADGLASPVRAVSSTSVGVTPEGKRKRINLQEKPCTDVCELAGLVLAAPPSTAELVTVLNGVEVCGTRAVHAALCERGVHVRYAVANNVSRKLHRCTTKAELQLALADEVDIAGLLTDETSTYLRSNEFLCGTELLSGLVADDESSGQVLTGDQVLTGLVQLFVSDVTSGRPWVIHEVDLSATVAALKVRVASVTKYPLEVLTLQLPQGGMLHDEAILSSYGIVGGMTINMVGRLLGGMDLNGGLSSDEDANGGTSDEEGITIGSRGGRQFLGAGSPRSEESHPEDADVHGNLAGFVVSDGVETSQSSSRASSGVRSSGGGALPVVRSGAANVSNGVETSRSSSRASSGVRSGGRALPVVRSGAANVNSDAGGSNAPLEVVAVAVVRPDEMLLVSQRDGSCRVLPWHWQFPGGKKESFETAKAAACREMLEEVGLFILPAQLHEVSVLRVTAGECEILLHLYAVLEEEPSILGGAPLALLETHAVRWVARGEVPMEPHLPSLPLCTEAFWHWYDARGCEELCAWQQRLAKVCTAQRIHEGNRV